jgi:signal transduction histidine kinase
MVITYRTNSVIQVSIALVVASSLLIIAWSAWQAITQPHIGALWADNGTVYYAHQNSDILVDDQVITIDGTPVSASSFPYRQWQRDDMVVLEVNRDNETLLLEVLYTERAPPLALAMHLSLIFTALTFWSIGLAVILLSSTSTKQNILFFLWCQTLGISLALGIVTGLVWTGHLGNILRWCAIALAIHFHLYFPYNQINWRSKKPVILMYGIAVSGILWRLLMATEFIPLPDNVITWYTVALYLWVLVGLSLVLLLLVRAYHKTSSPIARRQIGVVTLCGFIAGMPLLTLSVFPRVFLGEMILPVQFTFLFLITIPVGYGYAIRKYQFIKIERYVSRSATAVYVIGLLCILYLGMTYLIQTLLHDNILTNPLANLFIIMTLVIAYNPLYRRLQKLVDYLLYGGWYDYPTVVGQVTHRLETTTGIEGLAETLSASIHKTMRVYWAYLLWQGQSPRQTVTCVSGNSEAPFTPEMLQPATLPNILRYLQKKPQPTNNQTIRREIDSNSLTTEEKMLLENSLVRLWVPIRGLENSLGVLILGPKYGGDLFDTEDMEILNVVSRQASAIFQNAQLIGELEEKVHENEQYKKEIIRTRENERKRISRELHDQIIQQLVGLKYHMAEIEATILRPQLKLSQNGQLSKSMDLQEEIGSLIQTTRHLCQNLRPAALDLGLIPSIRSVVNRFEMEYGLKATLVIEGDRAIPVNEDIALCLFRCTGEALANSYKHAVATQVTIGLLVQLEQVLLTINDNGIGFTVPQRLGSFMEQNHFGLVGMRERVELLNGTFQITSSPAHGTCLKIVIPLSDNHVPVG